MKTHYLIIFNPLYKHHFNQQLKAVLKFKSQCEQRGQNPNWHIHYVSQPIPAQALRLREIIFLAQRHELQVAQHIAQLKQAFHTAPIERRLAYSRLTLLRWRLKYGWSTSACLMPQHRRITRFRRFKWSQFYRHTKALAHFSMPATI